MYNSADLIPRFASVAWKHADDLYLFMQLMAACVKIDKSKG